MPVAEEVDRLRQLEGEVLHWQVHCLYVGQSAVGHRYSHFVVLAEGEEGFFFASGVSGEEESGRLQLFDEIGQHANGFGLFGK